jgi:mannose-1-phosphate guanylyltransferase
MLAHIGARLREGGVERAVVNTHHLAEAFTEARLAEVPLPVEVIHEPRILGTGGGVANAARALGDGDVLVWNGDILIDIDVGALVRRHRERGALATMAIAPRAHGRGTIGIDDIGRVRRLRAHDDGAETASGDFVGVAILSPAARALLPDQGCWIDALLPHLAGERGIATFPVQGPWDDVGTLASYLAANLRWLGERRWYAGPRARIATGVTLERAIVGADAIIEGEGLLRDVVIYPGARARAPLERAIVTPARTMLV